MGGSGGGGGGSGRPIYNNPKDLFSYSAGQTDEKFDKTQVEELLREKLKELNDHDYEAINTHRQEIENKLKSEYEEFETLLYGGSHSRYTDLSKLSDIDILAVLGDSINAPASSNEAISQLASALRQRFPQSEIETGQMAVTIKFSDGIEVQVLPAYRQGDGFHIPNAENSGWVKTCPSIVANRLTDLNKRLSGQVVPVIKLAKAICNAQGVAVKSYHLENMALQAFEAYSGQTDLPQMLEHLFSQAKSLCHRPMSDPCGQSSDITN